MHPIGMNLLSGVLGTAALVLAPLAVPSPAQAAAPSSGVESSGVEASNVKSTGVECAGKEVVRCVWFNVDRSHHRLRAHSGIWDAAVSDPDPNYTVATSRVRLQRHVGGTWRSWSGSYAADHDGWDSSVDRAAGGLVGCRSGSRYTVRAVVYQRWKGPSPGAGTQHGPVTAFVC